VLVCVGGDDPEKADALDRGVIEAAKARGVRFLGHRDDVDELLAAFDVFVLASHREGYPRAAMEAAAMGLPIVATDIRGCREIVESGVNGALVPVEDAPAIARALLDCSEPARREEYGRASRARAQDRFDERAVVRRVLRTYAEVARRKHVPLALDDGG
jgi:glycosyltransferase involved in cell wall biosynthesis